MWETVRILLRCKYTGAFCEICANFAKLLSITYEIRYWSGGKSYLIFVKLLNSKK